MSETLSKLVLASNNQGKLKEFNQLLSDAPFSIHAQSEWQVFDAEETGLSFVENAIIKARHAAKITQLPALADDSGLAVDALQGQPGIYSARFSGKNATDAKNNQKLLELLAEIPEEQRTASFHCILVLLRHAEDPTPRIFEGCWHGRILFEAVGENGFGYDPLFWVPSHQCSSAQLAPEVKNRISHRGQAMQQLLQHFSHMQQS